MSLYVQNIVDPTDDDNMLNVIVDPDGDGDLGSGLVHPDMFSMNKSNDNLGGAKFVLNFNSVAVDGGGWVASQYQDVAQDSDTTVALWMVMTSVSASCSASHIVTP